MKQTIVISLIATLLLLINSCDSSGVMKFSVEHRQVLQGIPSASGIVKERESFYVVGDNSAWLYQLNHQYDIIDRHLLLEELTDSIIPKVSKPDFEAMTSIENDGKMSLLIFGSGSKSPERDVIVKVNLTNGMDTSVYHSTAFYDAIRSSGFIDPESINVEAAATVGDTLYLFNREYNLIFEYNIKDVLGFLEGSSPLPTYHMYRIELPQLNGISAKFSGASSIPESRQFLFTASVENTPNTYDDGEVMGSYVGIIELKDLKNDYQPNCVLITENSKPLKIKVESVDVDKINIHHKLNIVMVTDSDGGESELITGELTW